MNSCGEDRDFLRNAVKRKNHIGSRNILRLKDIVTYTVNGCRRRERHPEVALLNHVVNNLDNLRIGRIRKNRPVSQSSGTKLHPATTAGNNMPTSKQFSNPQLDVLRGFYAYLMRKSELRDSLLNFIIAKVFTPVEIGKRLKMRHLATSPTLLSIDPIRCSDSVCLITARRE